MKSERRKQGSVSVWDQIIPDDYVALRRLDNGRVLVVLPPASPNGNHVLMVISNLFPATEGSYPFRDEKKAIQAMKTWEPSAEDPHPKGHIKGSGSIVSWEPLKPVRLGRYDRRTPGSRTDAATTQQRRSDEEDF